jgi:hypothetical protein
MDDLRGAYANAILAFNAASATLILKFAANVLPTDEQIAAEEKARAAVIAARRDLWAAQQLRAQPVEQTGEAILPELNIAW